MKDAGDAISDTITKSQFVSFLQKLSMLPTDILALQRIVGFCDGTDTLKISDILTKLKERADKRSLIEIDTLKTLAAEFKAKSYSIQDAFSHLDADDSGQITLEELEDGLRAMKIQISSQTTKNILSLFDTDHDNQISLVELEKQLAPFMGAGRVQTLKVEDLKDAKMDEETKQALVEDMEKEQKKKVAYEDFSLKDVNVKDSKLKDQMILESLQKGTLPAELINGELKLQFEESLDLLSAPGKAVPYISIQIANFTAEGKNVSTLNTKPVADFNGNFNTAVRIPFINKDKNKISDLLQIDVNMQASMTQITPGDSAFIGEFHLAWKQLLQTDQWNSSTYQLKDEDLRCKVGPAAGSVKVFAKWIPAGSAESKFDEQGNKKGAEPVQQV